MPAKVHNDKISSVIMADSCLTSGNITRRWGTWKREQSMVNLLEVEGPETGGQWRLGSRGEGTELVYVSTVRIFTLQYQCVYVLLHSWLIASGSHLLPLSTAIHQSCPDGIMFSATAV